MTYVNAQNGQSQNGAAQATGLMLQLYTCTPFIPYLHVAPRARAGDRTPRRIRHVPESPIRDRRELAADPAASERSLPHPCEMVVEASTTAATLAPNLSPSSPIHGSGGNQRDGCCDRSDSSPAAPGGFVVGWALRSQAELVLRVEGRGERVRTVATRVVEAAEGGEARVRVHGHHRGGGTRESRRVSLWHTNLSDVTTRGPLC